MARISAGIALLLLLAGLQTPAFAAAPGLEDALRSACSSQMAEMGSARIFAFASVQGETPDAVYANFVIRMDKVRFAQHVWDMRNVERFMTRPDNIGRVARMVYCLNKTAISHYHALTDRGVPVVYP